MTIVASDLTGTVFAQATSDQDGSFLVSVVGNALELKAESATLPVTVIAGRTVMAGQAFPIPRSQAVSLVLQEAGPSDLVAVTFNPLPEGTLVTPAFGDENGDFLPTLTHTVGSGGEFLALVDPTPDAQWSHPVRYLFVSAVSGEVSVQEAAWLPAVEDTIFFQYNLQLVGSTDTQALLSGQVVQLPAASQPRVPEPTPPASGARPNPDPDLFAFVLAGSPENWFLQDRRRILEWLASQGVPPDHITVSEFTAAIPIPRPPFSEERESPDARAARVREEFLKLAEKVQARAQEGGDPCLFVFAGSHGNKRGEILLCNSLVLRGLDRTVRGTQAHSPYMRPVDELMPLQQVVSACHLQVLLCCCYASNHVRRWQASLPPDLAPSIEFFTSSGEDLGKGNDELIDFFNAPSLGSFVDAVVGQASPDPNSGTTVNKNWTAPKATFWDEDHEIQTSLVFSPFGGAEPNGPQRTLSPSSSAPVINSVDVNPLPNGGDRITVNGRNLGGAQARVFLAGVRMNFIVAASETHIVFDRSTSDLSGRVEIRVGCFRAVSDQLFFRRPYVLTEYLVNYAYTVTRNFSCPDLVFDYPDLTGGGPEIFYVDPKDGAGFLGAPGLIDAAGNFQLHAPTPSDLTYPLSGQLGPEGAFSGDVTEVYVGTYHLNCFNDSRDVHLVLTPSETKYHAQLMVDFSSKQLTDDTATTFDAEVSKSPTGSYSMVIVGTLGKRYTLTLKGGGTVLDGKSLVLEGQSTDGEVMTLTGDLSGDGSMRGRYTLSHPDGSPKDAGSFLLFPDTFVLLKLGP